MHGRLLITIMALCCAGAAQSFNGNPQTLKSGPWTVYRSIDKMTDAVVCTGIYKTNFNVQLYEEELLIQIRGGIRGVIFRFGDEPAQPLRLATKMERDARVVIIPRQDVEKAIAAGRLRLQAVTALNDSALEDIDMTGAKQALEHIQGKCPLPPGGATRVPEATVSGCSPAVKERLGATGMSPAQIAAVCDAPAR